MIVTVAMVLICIFHIKLSQLSLLSSFYCELPEVAGNMNVRSEILRPGDSEHGLSRGKSQRPTEVLNDLFTELAVLSTDDSRPSDSSTVSV